MNFSQVSMKKVTENAYKQYIRSRPAASSDSNRRVKEMPFDKCGTHPIFKERDDYVEEERENLLDQMKSYRPQGVRSKRRQPTIHFPFSDDFRNLWQKQIPGVLSNEAKTLLP